MAAALVDTNILVYLFDPRDHVRQAEAMGLMERLVLRRDAVLSVQCLTEFFRAVRWRLPEPLRLAPDAALAEVARCLRACRVLELTPLVVWEACRGANTFQLSIWDALIWATAKLNQIPMVLSEDFAHNRWLEGVLFLNPFDPAFDLAALGSGR